MTEADTRKGRVAAPSLHGRAAAAPRGHPSETAGKRLQCLIDVAGDIEPVRVGLQEDAKQPLWSVGRACPVLSANR